LAAFFCRRARGLAALLQAFAHTARPYSGWPEVQEKLKMVGNYKQDQVHLFLDYDGPLHPDEVYRVKGQIILRADGIQLFEYAPILVDILEPFPNVKIVLATSWVRVLGFDTAKNHLPLELQQRVVGATYHSEMDRERPGRFEYLSRYQQISQYVVRHKIERWVALDNDDYGWPNEHRQNLVHVDDWLGLFELRARDELRLKLEILVITP
jgi:hypothetical protein